MAVTTRDVTDVNIILTHMVRHSTVQCTLKWFLWMFFCVCALIFKSSGQSCDVEAGSCSGERHLTIPGSRTKLKNNGSSNIHELHFQLLRAAYLSCQSFGHSITITPRCQLTLHHAVSIQNYSETLACYSAQCAAKGSSNTDITPRTCHAFVNQIKASAIEKSFSSAFLPWLFSKTLNPDLLNGHINKL